jgi:hypothetical protein
MPAAIARRTPQDLLAIRNVSGAHVAELNTVWTKVSGPLVG